MKNPSGIRQGGLTRAALERWHEQRPAVAVGIPMTEVIWRTAFWHFMFVAKALRSDDHLMPITRTATPGDARNSLINTFLTDPQFANAEYLLLFDSDMTVLERHIDMLTWSKSPFMSGYCSHKSYPFLPIPAMYAGDEAYQGGLAPSYKQITNWEPNSGIHVCDGVGAAALCLRRDLLEAVGSPWFKHEHGGEDYFFCRRVQSLGHMIAVNTNVLIGHIGETVSDPKDWFKVKQQYEAEIGETEVYQTPPTPAWVPTAAD